ncbi:HAD family hydrolase [Oceanicella actignis]|uniref:phosphoglycolate phosphatase n=1 Tax=Oceanicella actignis TaxID=1189325 RepID=A0A1M7SQF4_9RHOB|nr:HAD-IA family hydrolase [Oceanicella actignis]TYO90825.1 phosphoglycolate phosphatase [Oceanicella actignis]SES66527.1 phosphoglycolate phosphatase [Oceanicella actignis]SHN60598.1 phosphoglycolate phosphatase [Oceanicella actignis]
MIRAILFDKDGTLFDFNATWRGFVRDALALLAPGDAALQARLGAAAGYDAASGAFAPGSPIVAGSVDEVARIWAPMIPGWDAASIERAANDLAARVGRGGLAPAAADLPALLRELRAMGCALGVATHDSENAARRQLAAVDALDLFDFVAGYDSGHGLKPGPGMVLAFCEATGVPPRATAMVGDSLHDLGAARAAGAGAALAVLTGPAGRDELAPHADAVLPGIEALPAWLRARAAAGAAR